MRRNDFIYATPAQEAYIRILRQEVQKYGTAEWPTITRILLKSEASTEIKMLKQAIEKGKARRS